MNTPWFHTKKGVYIGTFNTGDAPPPEGPDVGLLSGWIPKPSGVQNKIHQENGEDMCKVNSGDTNSSTTGSTSSRPSLKKDKTNISRSPSFNLMGRFSRAKSEGSNSFSNAAPPLEPLPGSMKDVNRYSMYCIGFQECPKFDDWVKTLGTYLGPSYRILTTIKMRDIAMVCFVSIYEWNHISMVETATEATGYEIASMQLGNKGGVAIGLKWHDEGMCFINSHLAPHQERSLDRNRDFSQIVSKLGMSAGKAVEGDMQVTHQYDHVFFFGDLNYRVNEDFKKAVALSNKGDYARLAQVDQLAIEMKEGRAFVGFQEMGPLCFPPSYRWVRGRNEFSNKKNQPPSYCDRILYYSRVASEQAHISPLFYGSHDKLMISDHRPVMGCFTVNLRRPFTPWPLHPLAKERLAIPTDTTDLFNTNTPAPPNKSLLKSASRRQKKGTAGLKLLKFEDPSVKKAYKTLKRASIFDRLMSRPSSQSGSGERELLSPRPGSLGAVGEFAHERKIPELFLGTQGSFYNGPHIAGCSPVISLEKVVVLLLPRQKEMGVKADPNEIKPPPLWIQMNVSGPVLKKNQSSKPIPGSEIHPEDILEGEVPSFVYESKNTYGELFYHINPSDFTSPLRPTLWDPYYLTSSPLLLSFQVVDKKVTKNNNNDYEVSIFGDSSGGGKTDSVRATIANAFASKKELVGQAAMCLSPVVEAARMGVVGSGWTRESSLSVVPFEVPIMLGGVKVGSVSGDLRLQAQDEDELQKRAWTAKEDSTRGRKENKNHEKKNIN